MNKIFHNFKNMLNIVEKMLTSVQCKKNSTSSETLFKTGQTFITHTKNQIKYVETFSYLPEAFQMTNLLTKEKF